jgi:hypothetical protein
MDVEHLKKLYTANIRRLRNSEWIRIPKTDEPLFEILAKTLDAKQMGYDDYINYHFNNAKTYITAKYICSPTAIMRYEVHQKMKGKYMSDNFSVSEDVFYVNKTYKAYPLSQVNSATSQDPDANFALTMAEKGEDLEFSQELWQACEYAMVKFEYKGKTQPTTLVQLTNKMRRTHEKRD